MTRKDACPSLAEFPKSTLSKCPLSSREDDEKGLLPDKRASNGEGFRVGKGPKSDFCNTLRGGEGVRG